MFLFQFLLVVHALIAAVLVTVILIQKSEGGGLGMGGSPSGLMSARGAADFLTRSTSILGGVFIAMSIGLAVLAAQGRSTRIDTTLARPGSSGATTLPGAPAQGGGDAAPFAAGARGALAPGANTAAPAATPTPAPVRNDTAPLAQ